MTWTIRNNRIEMNTVSARTENQTYLRILPGNVVHHYFHIFKKGIYSSLQIKRTQFLYPKKELWRNGEAILKNRAFIATMNVYCFSQLFKYSVSNLYVDMKILT